MENKKGEQPTGESQFINTACHLLYPTSSRSSKCLATSPSPRTTIIKSPGFEKYKRNDQTSRAIPEGIPEEIPEGRRQLKLGQAANEGKGRTMSSCCSRQTAYIYTVLKKQTGDEKPVTHQWVETLSRTSICSPKLIEKAA